MPDRRLLLWPLLAYGALSLVALARRAGGGEPLPAREPTERERPGLPPGRESTPGQEKESLPRPEDLRRLQERGRGREASAPWDIPRRGWKDILWRLYAKINDNRLLAVAAGVVFYEILALFPALTALVSVYGFFADASNIDQQVSALSGVLPGGAVDILHEEIKRLAAVHNSGLSFGFAFGLLFALWSANSGMKAIIDALNVAYEEKEKRSFIRLNLISLVMTLVAMVSLMLMLGAVVAAPIILAHIGLGGISAALIAYLRWPILVVLVVAGLGRALPLCAEPTRAALAVAVGRRRHRCNSLARQLCALVLVHRQFWPLQRHLRIARRGHRHDDVDVDLGDRGPARRAAQRGDRAPDRARLDGRSRQAAWSARRDEGRHDRPGAGLRPRARRQRHDRGRAGGPRQNRPVARAQGLRAVSRSNSRFQWFRRPFPQHCSIPNNTHEE